MKKWASLVAQTVKNLPAMWESRVPPLDWENRPEKEIATHSSILAWRILWTEDTNILFEAKKTINSSKEPQVRFEEKGVKLKRYFEP